MDFGDMDERIARLTGPGRVSLARRMALAGGKVPQREAKANALQSFADTEWVPNPEGSSASSQEPGTLSEAIYLAFNKKSSTDTLAVYSISWNNTMAWWGRLREFGYLQTHKVYRGSDGRWWTSDALLDTPKPRPAHPILAPAFDGHLSEVRTAMIAKGREELPKILNGDIGG